MEELAAGKAKGRCDVSIVVSRNGTLFRSGRSRGSITANGARRPRHPCSRRDNNNQFPATLAELVPKYLPLVPIDPFDGQPLRYRPDRTHVLLYSVGQDQKDDGGRTSPARVTRFRLHHAVMFPKRCGSPYNNGTTRHRKSWSIQAERRSYADVYHNGDRCILFASTTIAAEEKLTAKGVEFFEAKIRPVLVQHCYACHSASAKEVKAGLLRSIVAKDCEKEGKAARRSFPPRRPKAFCYRPSSTKRLKCRQAKSLPDDVIADFEKWIDMGAPDPRSKSDAKKRVSLAEARDFWSFQPVKNCHRFRHEQCYVAANRHRSFRTRASSKSKQLAPVGRCRPLHAARRVTFDLTGLPPTPQEIEAFLADDDDASAMTRWSTDCLIRPNSANAGAGTGSMRRATASRRGKERNIAYPYAWRYRDYVIDAFNADKPYNRFIHGAGGRRFVAGQERLPSGTNNLVATGFLAIGTKSLQRPASRAQFAADVVDEQIDVADARRCWASRLPVPAATITNSIRFRRHDYYAMAGIFKAPKCFPASQPGNNKSGFQGQYAYLVSQQTDAKKASSRRKIANQSMKLAETKAGRQLARMP